MRDALRKLVENIVPCDYLERDRKESALKWIESGQEILDKKRNLFDPHIQRFVRKLQENTVTGNHVWSYAK